MSLADGPYFIQTDANGFSACLTEVFDFTVNDISADVYSPQVIIEDPNVEPMSPDFEEASVTLMEEIICTATVDVEETPVSATFRIYPNPAGEYITIENENDITTGKVIEIYNILGDLLQRTDMYDQKMMIKNAFPPGLYFISIANGESKTLFQQKLVIH